MFIKFLLNTKFPVNFIFLVFKILKLDFFKLKLMSHEYFFNGILFNSFFSKHNFSFLADIFNSLTNNRLAPVPEEPTDELLKAIEFPMIGLYAPFTPLHPKSNLTPSLVFRVYGHIEHAGHDDRDFISCTTKCFGDGTDDNESSTATNFPQLKFPSLHSHFLDARHVA